MAISKINFVQALGSIASLLLFLFLPIVGVSFLIPIGFSGELCLRLDTFFVIPLVLLALTLIISLLPIGPLSSIAGILTSIGLLVIGLVSKNIAAAKLDALIAMSGLTGEMNLQLGAYASLMLKMSWGLILPVIIMAVTAIVGLVLGLLLANRSSSNRINAARGYTQRNAESGSSHRTSLPTRSTAPTSHRVSSTHTRYHR